MILIYVTYNYSRLPSYYIRSEAAIHYFKTYFKGLLVKSITAGLSKSRTVVPAKQQQPLSNFEYFTTIPELFPYMVI